LAKSSYKSIGTTLSWRLTRNISIKGTYNPIFQKVQIEGTKDLKFNSYIASGVLTISGGKREFKTVNNIVFNYYNYYDGISVNDYKSALINSGIIYKSFKNDLCGEWNKISNDTTYGNNIIIKEEIGFKIRKVQLATGVKWGYNDEFKHQYGFKLKLNFPIYKGLTFEVAGEKLLYGEYFYLENQSPDMFLFNCYGRLSYGF